MNDTRINSLTRAQVFALLLTLTYLTMFLVSGGILFLLAAVGLI